MRNPNGYGTVAKLSGNRRNPFVVRKTAGWNEKGHPIYLTIGYCPTREDGLMLLARYNQNPWNVDAAKITFSELFQMWEARKAPKLGASNLQSLRSAKRHCAALLGMRYRDIRSYHMQEAVDGCGLGPSTQGAIKNLFHHLDRFAFELDIIAKCYSDIVTTAPAPESTRRPFTNAEVDALWAMEGQPWVDSILVLLYSGFRISELLALSPADADLQRGTLCGGSKTRAGKNRIVPIHSKIAHLVAQRHAQGGPYLFAHKGQQCSLNKYYGIWGEIMQKLGQAHTPHECRHTFRSRLDSAGGNRVCIDLLMGHKSPGVGERVYTHKTLQELKDTVELITG